jgi:hypothetical protein
MSKPQATIQRVTREAGLAESASAAGETQTGQYRDRTGNAAVLPQDCPPPRLSEVRERRRFLQNRRHQSLLLCANDLVFGAKSFPVPQFPEGSCSAPIFSSFWLIKAGRRPAEPSAIEARSGLRGLWLGLVEAVNRSRFYAHCRSSCGLCRGRSANACKRRAIWLVRRTPLRQKYR